MELGKVDGVYRELQLQKSAQTLEFRWKAAHFIAKNILPSRASSAIQCNLLDGVRSDEYAQVEVCKFCKCVLDNTTRWRLLPRKVHGKKLRSLMYQVKSSSDGFSNYFRRLHVSKFERSLIKKCKLRPANTMVMTCSVCLKSHKSHLRPWKETVFKPRRQRKNNGKPRKNQKNDQKPGLKLMEAVKSGQKEATAINLSKQKNHLSSMGLPGMKQADTHQNKILNKPLLKAKVKAAKLKGKPQFIPKFQKGNRLANMIAQEEASKLAAKKSPKSNIFALLNGRAGK